MYRGEPERRELQYSSLDIINTQTRVLAASTMTKKILDVLRPVYREGYYEKMTNATNMT